ncbi:MAG: WYL domain-containing protein [Nevskiaceae bacterium]|nr:MAG: WYL domain-containing protein [Nevskiaceae bacterium]TAM25964.1 MAG: WYL domain-containing protein [Nevskiaceae bacterium]
MPRKTSIPQNRRLLTLLDALPVEGQHGLGPSEIADRMSRVFGIDDYLDPEGCRPGTGQKRLQRDLVALENLFGSSVVISAREVRNRPLFWKSAALKLPGLDAHTALAFKVAGEMLRPLLPPPTYERLADHFAAGERALAQLTRVNDWHNKVAVVPRGQPLRAPMVDQHSQEQIQQALFEGRQLRLRYRKKWDADATDYEGISPAGLLVRGNISYLIAFKSDDEQPRQFALHRVQSAEKLYSEACVPAGFSLRDFVARGEPSLRLADQAIELHLLITADAAQHLRETPLSANQQLGEVHADGRLLLTATLAWTQELEWWLLGMGSSVEVLEPISLRQEISKRHREAACRYDPVARS